MGCRRRHAHRRPILQVTEAETTADLGALTGRLHKAVHEAEGMPVAGQAPEARSTGQHEPGTAP